MTNTADIFTPDFVFLVLMTSMLKLNWLNYSQLHRWQKSEQDKFELKH